VQFEITDVTKIYKGDKTAVSGVTMHIKPGVLGLLGPNGAGKSSLLRILATITRPTSGSVTWNDQDIVASPDQLRRVLGYLPQDFGVYPHLTASEFLSYLGAVKGLSAQAARARIDELLDLVNLNEARSRPLGQYSGGMRQRVGIAQALLNDPELLIVDEPTAGLDPEERIRFRELLGDLAADRIVILSTHIVSDIEAIAQDIAILARGSLRYHGSPDKLIHTVKGRVWEMVTSSEELAAIRQQHVVSRANRTPEGMHIRVLANKSPATTAKPAAPDLEDAYLWTVHTGMAAKQPLVPAEAATL
jgi:ABC-2 type transport system ATP-binding protein